MNEEQYEKWKADARTALLAIYSQEQTNKIVNWFDSIKSSNERDLIGEKNFQIICSLQYDMRNMSLYQTMMARLWLYAPYILDLKD